MMTLKKRINRYLLILASVSIVIMLVINVFIQAKAERRLAYEDSMRTFTQIEQILDENRSELDRIQEEYAQTCLKNAEAIARIVEGAPEAINDLDELKKIAEITEVDEIHFFDTSGCIFAGTHPEYYGYSFDSGEQMAFFKPMLEDKSLRLVQDITANTAEGKPMQYSAIWNRTGDIIVQVGMEPTKVMKVREKNQLSYIFSLFRVDSASDYYAIDAESGEIVGSTVLESVGKKITEVGLGMDEVTAQKDGFFSSGTGRRYYCAFKKLDRTYLGRVMPAGSLYQRIPRTVLLLSACLAATVAIVACAMSAYMDRSVVQKLHDINERLQAIAMGDLDETINIQSSIEFSELSRYLNIMIKCLLDGNKKMSYVLSKADTYIGVYEYNRHMRRVRYTEYLPRLLALSATEMEEISSDYNLFKNYMDEIRKNPVQGEAGVYRLSEQSNQYIKLEDIEEQNEIMGVVIDVTEEIARRRRMEFERDADPLTGLYNRRGLDGRVRELFKCPEKLGHSAFVMIDADGLKTLNDSYGHEKGDIYLKGISQLIRGFEPAHSMAARQGGDEFILFLYRYETEEELANALKSLEDKQDHELVRLDDTLCVTLRFSFGYCLTRPDTDYPDLIKEADRRMYQNKRDRKAERP